MSSSVGHASQESADSFASMIAAWSELKSYLDRRSHELNEEVRNYPTPIARCDEQLTKLIEERTRAVSQLQRLIETEPSRSGPYLRRLATLEKFLATPPAFPYDETETAIRARLRATLARVAEKK